MRSLTASENHAVMGAAIRVAKLQQRFAAEVTIQPSSRRTNDYILEIIEIFPFTLCMAPNLKMIRGIGFSQHPRLPNAAEQAKLLNSKSWRRKVPGGAAGLQNQSGGRKVPGGFDSLPSPPTTRRQIGALNHSPGIQQLREYLTEGPAFFPSEPVGGKELVHDLIDREKNQHIDVSLKPSRQG